MRSDSGTDTLVESYVQAFCARSHPDWGGPYSFHEFAFGMSVLAALRSCRQSAGQRGSATSARRRKERQAPRDKLRERA